MGARYVWLKVNPAFGNGWPNDVEGKPLQEIRLGRLSVIADHDTRNNIFSPSSVHFIEGEMVFASPELGGTTRYQQNNLRAFGWLPVGKSTVLGAAWRCAGQSG